MRASKNHFNNPIEITNFAPMQKMKRIGMLLITVLLISSCGEYSKVLNKGTIEEQYKMAAEMYDAKKYNKAISLFDKITPGYRGKPQMERIQFMISDAHYQTKQYSLSAYYFDRFTKNYPKSTKREEAAFLAAHSYYLDSPVYSLDQAATNDALLALQKYIDTYPNSNRIEEANLLVKDLRYKLEKKAFETAKQFYHIEDYTAAITAFDNLISDYLGTTFREEAMFLKFKASHDLALKSVFSKKEERLKAAESAYDRLKRNYPESSYFKEGDKLMKDVNEALAEFAPLVVTNPENK
ncbi:outer membrane protein assembly factor BamD [Urechidicola sp. KH5]